MAARRIAFVNCKGGVGKTTLTVNLALTLSLVLDKKVLVVDLDAQSNSSVWLMRLERWLPLEGMPGKTVCAFFKNGILADAIHKAPVEGRTGAHVAPKVDLLPAIYDLMDLDNEVSNDPAFPYYNRFYFQLHPLFDEYDYILFDCPPSLGKASKCALYASEEVFVPCLPDFLSGVGLRFLQRKMEQFRNETAETRRRISGHLFTQIRGVILNAVPGNADIGRAVAAIHSRLRDATMTDSEVVAADVGIVPPQIRDTIRASRAIHEQPLALGNDKLQDDYSALALWIDKHPPQRRRRSR